MSFRERVRWMLYDRPGWLGWAGSVIISVMLFLVFFGLLYALNRL